MAGEGVIECGPLATKMLRKVPLRRFALFVAATLAAAVAAWLWLVPAFGRGLRVLTVVGFIASVNTFYLYNVVFRLLPRGRWVAVAALGWYAVLFAIFVAVAVGPPCLLYTSPSPRD